MIERKKGIINELIYDNTVYHNGEYRMYPSLPTFVNIINMIISSNSTTRYIKFTPFYKNAKLNAQVEFEKMIMYIECTDETSCTLCHNFLLDCCDEDEEINDDIIKRFLLCNYQDTNKFSEFINNYILYLDFLVPQMVSILKNEYQVCDTDMMFGYFCFEIESN